MATVAASIEELTASYLEQLVERTPRSHELRAEAERVLAGGVSGHFKAWQPFYVREAKGSHLTDIDGNDYVDLVMGFECRRVEAYVDGRPAGGAVTSASPAPVLDGAVRAADVRLARPPGGRTAK